MAGLRCAPSHLGTPEAPIGARSELALLERIAKGDEAAADLALSEANQAQTYADQARRAADRTD